MSARVRISFAGLLVLVVASGAALRLYHVRAVGGLYAPHVDQEEGYYEAGISQLSCHSLANVPNVAPSAFRAPLYPSFLALIESFFRLPSPAHPRTAQALLSTLAVATTAMLGWLLFSPSAGIIAGAMLAFSVDDILSASSLNIHGFYGVALLGLGVALARWLERRSAWSTGLLGLMLAATLLCRPAHFPFPFLLIAAVLWRWPFPEGRARALFSVGAATALFLAPMSLRNGMQFGHYSPFDLKGSYILLRSTTGPHLNTTVDEALDDAEAIAPGFKARNLEERPLHEALIRLSVRQILSAPWTYAGYCLERFYMFWRGLWMYLALAAYALWRHRENRPLEALILTAASLSGYAMAGGTPEYRVAAVPLLCVTAGAGLAAFAPVTSSSPPTAATKKWLRGGILLLPASFVLIYAAMAVFIALELRDRLRPGAAPALSDSCPDGRAEHLLMLGALQGGQEGPRRYWLDRAALETRAGEREAALSSLARADRLNPDAAGRRRMAFMYRELKDYHRASVLLGKLLAPAENDAALLLERAELEARMGKRDAAVKSLARAAASNPDDAVQRRVIGLYGELREYGRAFALLEPLRRLRPHDARLWLERAELEARSGARDAARASLRRAEDLSSKDGDRKGEMRHRLALVYQSLGDYARALAVFDGLRRQFPYDGEIFSDMGLCAYLNGEPDEAMRHLETAIRLKPKFIPSYLTLGAIYTGRGRYREALRIYDEGLRFNPSGTAYPLRGVLLGERAKILRKAGMLH